MSGANEDGSITWHYEYNIDQPPERADKPTVVRFIVLSDTHSTEPDVPNGVGTHSALPVFAQFLRMSFYTQEI